MRLLENRTGNKLANPIRILSALRAQWDEQRFPALQALADIGHEVVYIDRILPLEGYRKVINKLNFDIAILWGNSLQNFLFSHGEPFIFDQMKLPYISLWTDNPVKHLNLIKYLDNKFHLGMFVPDTRVIEQLSDLGFEQLFYLPPFHIDPKIFRPIKMTSGKLTQISFAATVNHYEYERARWRKGWNSEMTILADLVIKDLRKTRSYIDVYDKFKTELDPFSNAFSDISHAMYFEQKALVREQLITAIGERNIDITGIGSATFNKPNITMHAGREWHDLSPVFCSANINLNLTPWPRSCHHRVFQITASKSLAVTDLRQDALNLYEPDNEVVYFNSLEGLTEVLDKFTRFPREAIPIREAGYKRFINNHTVGHRMAELARIISEII